MLSVDELIEHMKTKGISFKIMSETKAKSYLHQSNNYFKLTSYRKNYTKCTDGKNKGKYENLEFAHLIELARIDVEVRHLLLKMCLDIEHFLKVLLIKQIEQHPKSIEYIVVEDFFKNNTHGISLDVYYNRYNHNLYCGQLVEKYKDNLPIWVLVELTTFGDLLRLIDFIYLKYGWELPIDYGTLDRIRQIRNATAHSNCIINDLNPIKRSSNKKRYKNSSPRYITNFVKEAQISKSMMQKKLSNKRIDQIVHLFYAYDKIVTSKHTKSERLQELHYLVNNRMLENKDYFSKNDTITSTYKFIKNIVNIKLPIDIY